MGCGCNKKVSVAALNAQANLNARRVTVYQVMVGSELQAEFNTLPEARKKAVEVAGRVKVTSKMLEG